MTSYRIGIGLYCELDQIGVNGVGSITVEVGNFIILFSELR